MNESKIKIRLGIVCIMAVIATVFLLVLFGGGKMPRFFTSDYKIKVILPSAPLLTPNSPVSKNGVEIGRVTSVDLVDEDRQVQITVRINGGIKLYTNEDCQLQLNILGQSALNFIPKPNAPRGEILAPGSTITGIAPLDIIKTVNNLENDLTSALRNFTNATKEVGETFQKVNQIIGTPQEVAEKQERLKKIVDQISTTMESFNRLAKGTEDLLNDPKIINSIKTSSSELPKLISDVKVLMTNANGMIADMKTMMGRADGTIGKVNQNLDNLSAFTATLGDDGSQFIHSLTMTADEINVAVQNLNYFIDSLNNSKGSIGKLLDVPQFFSDLSDAVKNANRTLKNAERLTQEIRPVVQNANVFTDKIAREPGLLGIKGLVTKSPPTKGLAPYSSFNSTVTSESLNSTHSTQPNYYEVPSVYYDEWPQAPTTQRWRPFSWLRSLRNQQNNYDTNLNMRDYYPISNSSNKQYIESVYYQNEPYYYQQQTYNQQQYNQHVMTYDQVVSNNMPVFVTPQSAIQQAVVQQKPTPQNMVSQANTLQIVQPMYQFGNEAYTTAASETLSANIELDFSTEQETVPASPIMLASSTTMIEQPANQPVQQYGDVTAPLPLNNNTFIQKTNIVPQYHQIAIPKADPIIPRK